MKRPLFHIALVLVALLYCGECVLPCGSACADACADMCVRPAALDTDAGYEPGHEHRGEHPDQDGSDRQSANGHCDHCSCICHSPIAPARASDDVSTLQSPALASSMIASLVWAEGPPPDHIPIL